MKLQSSSESSLGNQKSLSRNRFHFSKQSSLSSLMVDFKTAILDLLFMSSVMFLIFYSQYCSVICSHCFNYITGQGLNSQLLSPSSQTDVLVHQVRQYPLGYSDRQMPAYGRMAQRPERYNNNNKNKDINLNVNTVNKNKENKTRR